MGPTGWVEAKSLAESFFTVLTGGPLGPEERLPRVADGTDIAVFSIYAVVLFLSNWVFRKTVVDSIARAAGVLKQSKIDKFSQATMELLNYGVFAVVGMIIVPKQPWSWPSAQWWEGYTSLGSPDYPGPHSKMSQALCAYYILYASRYMANIFSVLK